MSEKCKGQWERKYELRERDRNPMRHFFAYVTVVLVWEEGLRQAWLAAWPESPFVAYLPARLKGSSVYHNLYYLFD